ncbi:MAG: hypothetical protein ABS79_06925 [Planctomycetes bacterium SCN 63-9]|nr:MAG: hypothetical protein ABS79_06925 [Planctomycetes bacterium SCN 63-9]
MLTFFESKAFSAHRDRLGITNDDLLQLQVLICKDPEAGDVIKGSGGFRKLRFAKPGSGKGKSGSFRVIYLHVPAKGSVLFFMVYPKSERSSTTAAEVKMFAIAAAAFKNEIEKG